MTPIHFEPKDRAFFVECLFVAASEFERHADFHNICHTQGGHINVLLAHQGLERNAREKAARSRSFAASLLIDGPITIHGFEEVRHAGN